MSSLSIEQRIAFIRGLELQTPLRSSLQYRGANAVEGEDSAVVDAGSAIAFVGNLTGQMKDDVIHSTLFAQLSANRMYDRENEVDDWYEYYKNVLETIGWVLGNFNLDRIDDADSYGSVDNLLLELARDYLPPDELDLFYEMINGLKEGNGSAVQLFDKNCSSMNRANFQVGVASNDGGDPTFKIGAYSYSASQNITNVLFSTFGSQKVLFYGGNQTMVLDEELYSNLRTDVLNRLGSNIPVREIDM